jgi:hypothetical protein
LQSLQVRQAGQALNSHTATDTGLAYQRLIQQYSR